MLSLPIFTQIKNFYLEEASYSEEKTSSKVKETVEEWIKIAQKKQTETLDPLNSESFFNSNFISNCILEKLKTHSFSDRIILCYDTSHNIQAIATINNEPLHITLECLISNPNNIRVDRNKENSTRIEGASSAIIANLFRKCIKENKHEIQVDSLSTTTEFYEKFHFEKVSDFNGITTKMKIVSIKIKDLISEELKLS